METDLQKAGKNSRLGASLSGPAQDPHAQGLGSPPALQGRRSGEGVQREGNSSSHVLSRYYAPSTAPVPHGQFPQLSQLREGVCEGVIVRPVSR